MLIPAALAGLIISKLRLEIFNIRIRINAKLLLILPIQNIPLFLTNRAIAENDKNRSKIANHDNSGTVGVERE